jgi:hypothetical protein
MSYGFMNQYHLTADSVSRATGVSKANLEFFRANEAELNRMTKEMQAHVPGAKAAEADGDSSEASETTG